MVGRWKLLEGRPVDQSQSFRRPVRRKNQTKQIDTPKWRNSDKSDASSEDGVVNKLELWPLARRRLLLRLVFRADGAEDSLATDHGAVAYFSVVLAMDYKPITLCNSHMTSQMALATPRSTCALSEQNITHHHHHQQQIRPFAPPRPPLECSVS